MRNGGSLQQVFKETKMDVSFIQSLLKRFKTCEIAGGVYLLCQPDFKL